LRKLASQTNTVSSRRGSAGKLFSAVRVSKVPARVAPVPTRIGATWSAKYSGKPSSMERRW
jgi:hypothetical protein